MLKPSPTLLLAAKAKELSAQGRKIFSLSVGEPDWATLPVAEEAGIQAIKQNQTKYAPAAGLPGLRESVAKENTEALGVKYIPAEVTVTAGGKFVLFSAFQCLLEEGDEVLIPAPYWVSYPTMVELAGATPKIVMTKPENRFRVQASEISAALNAKTKMLILNSPSNPTGEVSTREELQAIAEVLRKYPDVFVVSDDIYNKLVFDGAKVAPHILHVAPDLKDRVLCVNGASKTLSMTGWRVGWASGPLELIKAMTDYQSQSVSCAAPFAQIAAKAALDKGQSDIEASIKVLHARRDRAVAVLKETTGLPCAIPDGAFYLWPSIQAWIGKKCGDTVISNSSKFCELLLEKQGVAVVPGIEFGIDGYLRMSYVISDEDFKGACQAIRKFTDSLQ
jgi:aspartate aminotransferase